VPYVDSWVRLWWNAYSRSGPPAVSPISPARSSARIPFEVGSVARDGAQDRFGERAPDHGRQLQGPSRRLVQRIHARRDQRLQGRRDREVVTRVRCSLEDGGRELLDEQRVALGPLQDPVPHRLVAFGQQLGDQRAALLVGEWG